jgi:hypothetical protein
MAEISAIVMAVDTVIEMEVAAAAADVVMAVTEMEAVAAMGENNVVTSIFILTNSNINVGGGGGGGYGDRNGGGGGRGGFEDRGAQQGRGSPKYDDFDRRLVGVLI